MKAFLVALLYLLSLQLDEFIWHVYLFRMIVKIHFWTIFNCRPNSLWHNPKKLTCHKTNLLYFILFLIFKLLNGILWSALIFFKISLICFFSIIFFLIFKYKFLCSTYFFWSWEYKIQCFFFFFFFYYYESPLVMTWSLANKKSKMFYHS